MEHISIHPPRFQSTRPVRGGTPHIIFTGRRKAFQSTRPVRGGTACARRTPSLYLFQSTRPVRGGTSVGGRRFLPRKFQSTRPVRGGTAIMHKIYPMHSCTIHNTTCSQTAIRIPTSVFLLIIRSPSACSPVFRCEPMGSALRASTSHGQIIRTSSGL